MPFVLLEKGTGKAKLATRPMLSHVTIVRATPTMPCRLRLYATRKTMERDKARTTGSTTGVAGLWLDIDLNGEESIDTNLPRSTVFYNIQPRASQGTFKMRHKKDYDAPVVYGLTVTLHTASM